MKIINLSSLESSDIKYKISQFPDGQQDIVINSKFDSGCYSNIPLNKDVVITIKSRFNSFRDLELIICATKALRRLGVKEIHLYIPYLLGARSDRHFQEGGNSYLVDVIAPIINAQGYESVTVLDVHSDVAAACINNLKVESNRKLVVWALNDICREPIKAISAISPDAGAQKKIYNTLEGYGIIKDVIVASKHRDLFTGKITSTKIPNFVESNWDNDFIIIDDICDGGRTFIEIAKSLKNKCPLKYTLPKIHLIVTHGIFSAGFDELFKYFDTIYTTNSIKSIGGLDGNSNKRINVKQIKVI